MLGPLQINGGVAATQALLPGSPAIDAIPTCSPPAQDQRGVTRPQGPACDIGAYETRTNQPPMANAGADQQVEMNTRVLLDGTQSSDPEGDPILYQWVFARKPSNSMATLHTPMASAASFIADQLGLYEVELQVRDTDSPNHSSDTLRITAISPTTNLAPIAHAGADQQAEVNKPVQLNGSASFDPENNPIQFKWTIISLPTGSTTALSTSTERLTTFIPDRMGLYEVHLQVRDDLHPFGVPDSVRITTEVGDATNQRPIANAGADQTVGIGDQATLNASNSMDPDGTIMRYEWQFVSTPLNTRARLNTPTAVMTSFVADREGTYELQLRVYDRADSSELDTIRITAEAEDGSSAEGSDGED